MSAEEIILIIVGVLFAMPILYWIISGFVDSVKDFIEASRLTAKDASEIAGRNLQKEAERLRKRSNKILKIMLWCVEQIAKKNQYYFKQNWDDAMILYPDMCVDDKNAERLRELVIHKLKELGYKNVLIDPGNYIYFNWEI